MSSFVYWRFFSITICVTGLGLLAAVMVCAWIGKLNLTKLQYQRTRAIGAFLISLHATVAVFRLTYNVALTRNLDERFIPELIGYFVFWILFPPLWFFLEYYAVDSGCIQCVPRAESDLKKMKDYSDLASKIWAAVIAILIGLVSLKK